MSENVHPALPRLFQRFRHDLRSDARNLDIHLKRRDTLARSGNFEVHVAVVIFGAGDVGKHSVVVAFLHESHRDAGHGRLDRNAGIHHRQRAAANRGHRR